MPASPDATSTNKPSADRADRARRLAVIGVVGLLHAGLFALAGLTDGPPEQPPFQRTINVELMRPPLPPPPPPPPPKPAETAGGGSPGASSPVRMAKRIVDRPREILAPPIPTPAPTPPPVLGTSPDPVPNPNPGGGQGGEGTGVGTGSGSGSGPGRGSTPPRFVRGPSPADLRSVHPPAALRAGRSGEAIVSCFIRADQYLHRCTVVSARPGGEGYEEAGLLATRFYRFQPPTRDGVANTEQPVTITVRFGRSPPRRD